MTTVTARNERGGIDSDSFADLTPIAVLSIAPGQSITVTFDGVLTDAETAAVVRRIETVDAVAEADRAEVEAVTFDGSGTTAARLAALESAFLNLRRLQLGR